MRRLIHTLFFALCAAQLFASETATVVAPNLTIFLDSEGSIEAATVGPDRLKYVMTAVSGLAGAMTSGTVSTTLADGGVQFRRDLGSSGTIVSTFSPYGKNIRWNLDVIGAPDQKPYSALIDTKFTLGSKGSSSPLKFWTAWDGGTKGWHDPFIPKQFSKARYEYGSYYRRGGGTVLPIATFIDEKNHVGISLIQSPADVLLFMDCLTWPDQTVAFSRKNHRIQSSNHIHFTMDIVVHEPDPRSALGWMVKEYPDYFVSHNAPLADEVGGGAGYAGYETPYDATKLRKMSFRVNWKASVDFPYMGMYLPPVEPDIKWNRFAGGGPGKYTTEDEGRFGQVSISQMADYAAKMRADNFHVLSYFNMTEFGGNIQYPPLPQFTDPPSTQPLWMNPNKFLYSKFPDAILHRPEVRHTWGGAVVTDCGDPAYQSFLLNQARRHIEEIPDASGICIDRLDWLNHFNYNADDGVSWIDGPVRFVGNSWKDTMAKLGPMMHKANKVIFANPLFHRIDFTKEIDGIYDEKADQGVALNASTFLALRKPLMAWIHTEDFMKPDPDKFFQRYLYMGSFLTCPVPGNDHCITPGPWVDAQFLRYGPLFKRLHARKWVLKAGPVSVDSEVTATRANVFEVPNGFVVPVVFGGETTSAKVTLHRLEIGSATQATALLPGQTAPVKITLDRDGDDVSFTTPLKSGCAMVQLISKPL